MNYFQAKEKNPYHLSIGAVVVNDKGEVCTHYFKSLTLSSWGGTFENFYILMRETIHPNETIEQCLHRGLMEEFGITASLEKNLGSVVSCYKKDDLNVQKTTLYFLCKLLAQDESKRSQEDVERNSIVTWVEPTVLIEKMKEQGKRLRRKDGDESVVIQRYLELKNQLA